MGVLGFLMEFTIWVRKPLVSPGTCTKLKMMMLKRLVSFKRMQIFEKDLQASYLEKRKQLEATGKDVDDDSIFEKDLQASYFEYRCFFLGSIYFDLEFFTSHVIKIVGII